MIICRCDRCGKERMLKGNSLIPDRENMPKYFIVDNSKENINTINLCDDCEKELDKFLNNN